MTYSSCGISHLHLKNWRHLNHWTSHQRSFKEESNAINQLLTFLVALNLSHNNLEWPIRLTNHFDTFSNGSFAGNSGLCGFPLSMTCGNDQEPKSPPSTVANESEIALIWKIAVMGYESGLVLGLTMGYIVFTTGRPRG
ncbi:hypothetical protein CXB51_009879 [Gossypium anomalum]|uniref:Uncharacterized protein n=1 Tax=Gossypium anomalum TaxID=47600 RepID=A0A8J5YLT4_9ROSI|nr:hypothetical protein CXB51_009879 [Gossypium anomalum]